VADDKSARGRELLAADMARMDAATADADASAAPEAVVSTGNLRRYALLERLGEGGMGVVYIAYDARLDRRVAIKVLRRDGSEAARARFRREAQALARLQHPNVVAVFDTGEIGERPYLAMELIDGTSLRRWLSAAERPWREIVRVMLAAGRGLAAAHAVGLVHRDIKPDNILVARDGVVKIADFGLARLADDLELRDATPDPPSGPMVSPLGQTLTSDGVVMGTPGFLPPEEKLDARSDQYSFCVTLHRVLEDVKQPAFLARIVSRGTKDEPALRYPSMNALLADLDRDPARTRLRFGLGAAALGVVATTIGLTAMLTRTPPPCHDAPAAMAGVWDPDRAAGVRAAIVASGSPDAEDTYRRVAARLDDYRDRWIAMRTETCEATAVHHTQSETLLDRRVACLDRRRNDLTALTGLLAGKLDAAAVTHATEAAAKLEDLAGCADAEALMAESPPSRDPRVTELEMMLSTANQLHELGHYEEGERLARDLLVEAPTIEHLPTKARALLLLPQMLGVSGTVSEPDKVIVEAALRQGLEVAAAAHLVRLEAARWPTLMWILVRRDHAAEALGLATAAYAAAARSGEVDARVSVEVNLAIVYQELGKLDEALAHAQTALALASAAYPADDLRLTDVLYTTAGVLLRLSRFDEGRVLAARRVEIEERVLGPNHPDVAHSLASLGEIDSNSEAHHDDARAELNRALVIYERALGPDTPEAMGTESSLATLATNEEHYEDAVASLRRVLDWQTRHPADKEFRAVTFLDTSVAELQLGDLVPAREHLIAARALAGDVFPPDHPFHGFLLDYLAALDRYDGRPAEAEAEARAALAILEKAKGPPYADASLVLASILTMRGRAAEAVPLAARAVAIYDDAAGKDAPATADALYVHGDALLAAGHVDEALATLERAAAIRAERGHDLLQRGRTRFALARARLAAGQAAPAREAAAMALADFQAARFGKRYADEVVAWQKLHP
jgi:serine/threonine-protein kinase